MRNVSNKGCKETQNTHFRSLFIFPEKCAAYSIIIKNTTEPDRP
jgi:hypothetical protein